MTVEQDWYKTGVFYEASVKAFNDSNGDGIGDFEGLRQKLDYIQELGITCIWLLPFYASPLRDDGYDIADYKSVHPQYDTLEDFKRLLAEAHQRNIRVLTDMVINHTSDQHAWFQEARRDPTSPKRDYYVWSDTDQKYSEARIIFTDSEASNWTWDEEAKAYYWHRFFYHQPDLNFESQALQEEMLEAMRFWLDMGMDGFRLDAVPYLFEQEGTNCENLPQTHDYLKKVRQMMDTEYPGRILLAEANQWPEDVRPYFGDGDECHMAFNFPIMPRLFMALRREERRPITEIMSQLPEIPVNCQWATFLRNHDELTLEMVTDEERVYMYLEYAKDPRQKINVGIRRRLAPLLENDRRQIELLNGLLFSLPGSPFIYYGDEIGMGDNIALPDRDGVRTPMQWSAEANGGFSQAAPSDLYHPLISDPVYGYQTLNVASQFQSEGSLFTWMKRLIALRKQLPILGHGSLSFLDCPNPKILAYLRSDGAENLLVVANLASSDQEAELDLSVYAGAAPLDLLANARLPQIENNGNYHLKLSPYGFHWLKL